jgi:hypothetical protein
MDSAGGWWSGCSLPLRAGRAALKSLGTRGTLQCFLAPPSAGYVRAALERVDPTQGLLLIVPESRDLRVMLACDDFSAEIAAHRLWFAAGEAWAEELRQIFTDHPGLPTPVQFIRLPGHNAEILDPLIEKSQKIFSDVLAERARHVQSLRQGWRPTGQAARKLCVVTGGQFRLWDDAGFALSEAISRSAGPDVECAPLRADEPSNNSPVAVALAAAACDAIVAANFSRADSPELLSDRLPWITWVTAAARVPSFSAASPRDGLLLADADWRDRARAVGWPADRIAVAAWPGLMVSSTEIVRPSDRSLPAGRFASIIADTRPLDPPTGVEEFSSHRLLWETIRLELHDNPFAIAAAPDRYLTDRLRRYSVSEEGLDRGLFREGLIVPAYTQGIARLLIRSQVPLRLFGAGWADMPEFAPHASGAVCSRADLAGICAASAALVHAWPATDAHPIDATGVTVVHGTAAQSVLRATRLALAGAGHHETPQPPLSADAVTRLLNAA